MIRTPAVLFALKDLESQWLAWAERCHVSPSGLLNSQKKKKTK